MGDDPVFWWYMLIVAGMCLWFITLVVTPWGRRMKLRNTACALIPACPSLIIGGIMLKIFGMQDGPSLSLAIYCLFLGTILPVLGLCADLDLEEHYTPRFLRRRSTEYDEEMDPPHTNIDGQENK